MSKIDAAIDAGIEACDLYEVACNDIISRQHLREFLKAALAKYQEKPKRRAKRK